jgi:hypothetical protein
MHSLVRVFVAVQYMQHGSSDLPGTVLLYLMTSKIAVELQHAGAA